MNARHAVSTLLAVAAAIVTATFASDPRALAQPGAQTFEPGEGVVCAWALYTTASEVGRRCYPGEHADVQAELHRAVSLIEAYVVANSKPPPTQQQLDKFKREYGNVGASNENLCRGDPDQLYRLFVDQGAPAIRKSVDALVSRPGEPAWGTCF